MSNRRQEIYDEIRNSSKQEYILKEMKRLGFWKEEEGLPALAEQIIKRESELSKELREILKNKQILENREEALKKIRKEKIAESRARQKENKEKKLAEREAKAKAWKEHQTTNINYLGEGVSHGLNKTQSDHQKLSTNNIPKFNTAKDLADAMNISVGELRFLTFSRKTSKTTHYRRFYIRKKTGGQRLISAPMPRLKAAQKWVMNNILYPVELHNAAHGFIPKRSIISNAEPHVGKKVVINMDVKNFFPTITYKRIKGVFLNLGYDDQVATILALLCSEPEVRKTKLDGETYYTATSERHLPQGAPCSPAITNLICRNLDKRLEGLAKKNGYVYTRYADDITFSNDPNTAQFSAEKHEHKLIAATRKILRDEGFKLHPDKVRIMRNGRKQEVTGIVVNQKINLDRKELKRFKSLLYHIEKYGLDNAHWKGKTGTSMLSSMRGYAQYVAMVNPEKGKQFTTRVDALLKTHQWKHEIKHKRKVTTKFKVAGAPKPGLWSTIKKWFGLG